jgi:hypothetical protein
MPAFPFPALGRGSQGSVYQEAPQILQISAFILP